MLFYQRKNIVSCVFNICNMKVNICEALLRRSVENHILTYRHNHREDEMLQEKFALYQRQIRLVDHNIHMAERRFEQHAKIDLGFVVTYKHKPLEPSKNHRFYYASTNKNWTTKEYNVEPLENVLQHKNLYEFAFERRSRQYIDELRQKFRSQKHRKDRFMRKTQSLIRDDLDRPNDWPLPEHARLHLPAIHPTKFNSKFKLQFSLDY